MPSKLEILPAGSVFEFNALGWRAKLLILPGVKTWQKGAGALLAVAVIIGIYHHFSHQAQMASMEKLALRFLTAESELPNAAALHRLNSLTVPGTQAALLAAWLEDHRPDPRHPLSVRSAEVWLTAPTLSHGNPSVLRASFVIVRHLSPRGQSRTAGTVNLWIRAGAHPAVEAVSVDMNPHISPETPDTYQPDLWNFVPAPALPHGQ